MKDLFSIKTIIITQDQLCEANNFLQQAGNKYFEAIALFAGCRENSVFRVKEVILPYQTSYKMASGLMFSVDDEELYRINTHLFENSMELIAQIHSHPGIAYHSETDDRYPIVDTFGGISIVVPDFASGPVDLKLWAIYRLNRNGKWESLSEKFIDQIFTIQ